MRKYKYYRFSGQDPIIGTVMKAIGNKSLPSVAREAGVSIGILYNWRSGKTRRPQFATIIAVLRAMDCNIRVVRKKDTRS